MLAALTHGGRLAEVAQQYQRPLEQWLDLSTGISPWSWPVPTLPAEVWQQLPNDSDDLENIAQGYYRAKKRPLAVPGSQWLIRQLPRFLSSERAVALPLRGYQEHQLAWQSQGYGCVFYSCWSELQTLLNDESVAYVLVINPNNPTALQFTPQRLLQLEKQLAQRQGLLIVDEAFADSHPDNSLLNYSSLENAVVLRSLGKFFGLAGIRLGFGFLPPKLFSILSLECQPWAVSHPARYIGRRCLQDRTWVAAQNKRLKSASSALLSVLGRLSVPLSQTDYFISVTSEPNYIERLHQHLMQQGVYIRRFEPQGENAMLRFGLCTDEQLPRLQLAIDLFLEQAL